MRIIYVGETPEQAKNPDDMDLLKVLVEYDNGEQGTAYIYRARVNAMRIKILMMAKYKISEKEMDELIDAYDTAYNVDHFYNDVD